MSWHTITLDTDRRGVATLTLNRPEKRNAISDRMVAELSDAVAALAGDDTVRVVVLTGAGSDFCAGGDLATMKGQIEGGAEARRRAATAFATLLGAFNALPKPVIGRIQGPSFGGGLGLMAVCDVAVAVEAARFGFTETRLGLIPATIGPYVVGKMGGAAARRVFMSARVFDADEAVTLGLLARAVREADLDAVIEAEVVPYLACAPGAVAAAKALALRLGGAPTPGDVAHSIDQLVACWESDETAEGVDAFLARRKPRWVL